MSFLSKIGLTEEVADDPKKVVKKTTFMDTPNTLTGINVNNTQQTQTYVNYSQPIVNGQPSPEEMQKFIKYFEDLMTKANLPGPDYFEFSKMIVAMGALDEPTRFTSAYMALQVQGVTKAALIQSANQYLQILENDRTNFENTVNSKMGTDVSNLKNEIEAKKNEITQKQDLINQLQGDINKANETIINNGNVIAEQEGKITAKLTGYRIAIEQMKQTINTNVTKISSYLTV